MFNQPMLHCYLSHSRPEPVCVVSTSLGSSWKRAWRFWVPGPATPPCGWWARMWGARGTGWSPSIAAGKSPATDKGQSGAPGSPHCVLLDITGILYAQPSTTFTQPSTTFPWRTAACLITLDSNITVLAGVKHNLCGCSSSKEEVNSPSPALFWLAYSFPQMK